MSTQNNDEVFVVCNYKSQGYYVESILTNCSQCNIEVWCSVTNAHRTPICFSCVGDVENPEFKVTQETLEEAAEYIKRKAEDG